MKRELVLSAAAIAASFGIAQVLAQVTLPWPGPGVGNQIGCTPNNVNGTFANVTHLYHMENNGTDSSGNGHTLSFQGAGNSWSTTQKKFGVYAYKGCTSANACGLAMTGTKNTYPNAITIEMFLYPIDASQAAYFGDYSGLDGSYSFIWSYFSTPEVRVGQNPAPNPALVQGISPSTPVANEWHHYAWTRDAANTAWKYYIDGVSQTLNTGAFWNANVGASFGNNWGLASYGGGSNLLSFSGYMDEVRISNVQRYPTNFTPPAAAFCNN